MKYCHKKFQDKKDFQNVIVIVIVYVIVEPC